MNKIISYLLIVNTLFFSVNSSAVTSAYLFDQSSNPYDRAIQRELWEKHAVSEVQTRRYKDKDREIRWYGLGSVAAPLSFAGVGLGLYRVVNAIRGLQGAPIVQGPDGPPMLALPAMVGGAAMAGLGAAYYNYGLPFLQNNLAPMFSFLGTAMPYVAGSALGSLPTLFVKSFYERYLEASEKPLWGLQEDYARKKPDIDPAIQKQIEDYFETCQHSPDHTGCVNYIRKMLNLPTEMANLQFDDATMKELMNLLSAYPEEFQDEMLLVLDAASHAVPGKRPILYFLGEPGVGKTYFIERLGAILNLPLAHASFKDVSNSNPSSGIAYPSGNAKPGFLVESLLGVPNMTKDGMVFFDELSLAFDPMSPYAGLLKNFFLELFGGKESVFDNYFNAKVDVSKLWFVAAGNHVITDPALANRLRVIKFPSPTLAGKKDIVEKSILPRLLNARGLSENALSEAQLKQIMDAVHADKDPGFRSLEKFLPEYISAVSLLSRAGLKRAPSYNLVAKIEENNKLFGTKPASMFGDLGGSDLWGQLLGKSNQKKPSVLSKSVAEDQDSQDDDWMDEDTASYDRWLELLQKVSKKNPAKDLDSAQVFDSVQVPEDVPSSQISCDGLRQTLSAMMNFVSGPQKEAIVDFLKLSDEDFCGILSDALKLLEKGDEVFHLDAEPFKFEAYPSWHPPMAPVAAINGSNATLNISAGN